MADVAARVGVSKMTVSRALNRSEHGGRSASQALRLRILQVCKEMGYVMRDEASVKPAPDRGDTDSGENKCRRGTAGTCWPT